MARGEEEEWGSHFGISLDKRGPFPAQVSPPAELLVWRTLIQTLIGFAAVRSYSFYVVFGQASA